MSDGAQGGGAREGAWDGRRDDGTRARPGLYFARTIGCREAARRIVLLE